jgi:predicted phage-related endonuclease
MAMGLRMEPTIGRFFMEDTGFLIRDEQAEVVHITKDFMRATLDGYVHDADGYRIGIIEKKCTTQDLVKVMPMYTCQVQWQLAVTGHDKGWLAILRNGNDFSITVIDADPLFQGEMMRVAEDFWVNNVLADVPPDVDGAERTREALNATRPTHGVSKEIPKALVDALKEAKAKKKAWEENLAYAENAVKALLLDAEYGTVSNKTVVSWVPRVTHTLDSKALKAEMPEIAAKYGKTTETRVFSIKEEKS